MIKVAPGSQCLPTLRARLAEVSPVEPTLSSNLNHEPLELAQAKLGVLQVKGVRRPLRDFPWHATQHEPHVREKLIGNLLRGIGFRVVRVNLVQGTVVARLRNREPQSRLAPGVTRVWLLIGVLTVIEDGVKPRRD